MPFGVMLIGFLGLVGLALGGWVWHRRRRLARNRGRLAGVLPAPLLSKWSDDPEKHLLPTDQELTVLFVHVVGFSVLAQKRSPEEAFRWLRRLLSELSDEAHQHGGMVDATVGDGILAVFGYQEPGEPALCASHADAALRCAIQMQINNGKRMMGAGEREEPVLPLRIGINTAPVFVGNVGQGERLDLTLIGSGVNAAKAFESGCENHCILMGDATRGSLREVGPRDVKLEARQVPMGLTGGLQEVWEARPLWRHPSMAERANGAFRKFITPDRAEERWPLPEAASVRVVSSLGEGVIENFSFSGLGIRFSSFLGRGTPISFELQSADPLWNAALQEAGLATLMGEVRWGAPGADGYQLGIGLRGISPVQRQQLLTLFRTFVRQSQAA